MPVTAYFSSLFFLKIQASLPDFRSAVRGTSCTRTRSTHRILHSVSLRMQRQGSMTGARTMAATNNQAPPPSGTLPTPRTVPARRDSLRPGGGEQTRDPMALLKRQATTRMAINSLLDVMGARNLQYDVQQDAMSFAEYDMDGNQRLDFEEASFPAGLHARTLVSSVLFHRLPSHSLTHSPPSMSARTLSHVQFYSMQPRLMRERYTPAEIRELFQAADANGDGSVSVNEVHETPPVLPKKLRGQHPLLVCSLALCHLLPCVSVLQMVRVQCCGGAWRDCTSRGLSAIRP